MRGSCLAGLLLVFAASAPPARADDAAVVEDAYQRAKAHVKAERWSSAVDALKKLMADNPGSAAVLERLGAIEADLRQSLFRLKAKHPSAVVLFGEAAKGFVVNERRLTLEYPEGPGGSDWSSVGRSHAHHVPFDSDLSVEFVAPTIESEQKTVVGIVLAEVRLDDRSAPTGMYSITPGACSEDGSYLYSLPGKIVRIDPKVGGKESSRELVTKPKPGKVEIGQVQTYRVVRRGTGINVSVDGKPFLVCQDGKFPITLVSLSAGWIKKLTLRGVVEKTYYTARLEKQYAAEQAEWEPKGYVRAEVLPQWVLDAAPAPAK